MAGSKAILVMYEREEVKAVVLLCLDELIIGAGFSSTFTINGFPFVTYKSSIEVSGSITVVPLASYRVS